MMIFIFFSCVLFAYLYAEDNMQTIFHNLTTPFFVGVLAVALIVLLLGATFHIVSIRAKRGKSQRRFSLTIDYLVENVYNFFEEILGERAPFRVKSYITNLFLVILIANLIGVILDILISPFPVLATYIKSPTSDISFTLALAIVSVVMVLVVEATTKGGGRFLYRYIPFFGTNIIRLSKETLSSPLYYLLRPFVKLFDIFISLFIALLDII
jgi:F0F1-type ATP synthase membrane subunit a